MALNSQSYKAARSVHAWWDGLDVGSSAFNVFVCDVVIIDTIPGSYFACCGFNGGYFGLQDHGLGRKRFLFSVWDTHSEMGKNQNDPSNVPTDKQVIILYNAPHVHIQRFGNEGTGAQCFDDETSWTTGSILHMYIVHCFCDNSKTDAMYAAFANGNHLATFLVKNAKPFGGFYSFIEDFKRDGNSAYQSRVATFGPAWLHKSGVQTEWIPAKKACFTASPLNVYCGESSWSERRDGINCRLETRHPGSITLSTGNPLETNSFHGSEFHFGSIENCPDLLIVDLRNIFYKRASACERNSSLLAQTILPAGNLCALCGMKSKVGGFCGGNVCLRNQCQKFDRNKNVPLINGRCIWPCASGKYCHYHETFEKKCPLCGDALKAIQNATYCLGETCGCCQCQARSPFIEGRRCDWPQGTNSVFCKYH